MGSRRLTHVTLKAEGTPANGEEETGVDTGEQSASSAPPTEEKEDKVVNAREQSCPSLYTRYCTFVVPGILVNRFLHVSEDNVVGGTLREWGDKKMVEFDTWESALFGGDNCCTFVAWVLRELNIDIPHKGNLLNGDKNLREKIEKYKEKQKKSSPRIPYPRACPRIQCVCPRIKMGLIPLPWISAHMCSFIEILGSRPTTKTPSLSQQQGRINTVKFQISLALSIQRWGHRSVSKKIR